MNEELKKIEELETEIKNIKSKVDSERYGLTNLHYRLFHNLMLQEESVEEIDSNVKQKFMDELARIYELGQIFSNSVTKLFCLNPYVLYSNMTSEKIPLYTEIRPILNDVEDACCDLLEFRNRITNFNSYLEEEDFFGFTDELGTVDELTQSACDILHMLLDLQNKIITIIQSDYNLTKLCDANE